MEKKNTENNMGGLSLADVSPDVRHYVHSHQWAMIREIEALKEYLGTYKAEMDKAGKDASTPMLMASLSAILDRVAAKLQVEPMTADDAMSLATAVSFLEAAIDPIPKIFLFEPTDNPDLRTDAILGMVAGIFKAGVAALNAHTGVIVTSLLPEAMEHAYASARDMRSHKPKSAAKARPDGNRKSSSGIIKLDADDLDNLPDILRKLMDEADGEDD